MSLLQTVLAFLVALTLLIFVHELGHFAVARWCGVKVLRFSIGFGPALWTRRFGADRTEWVVAAIPLGGYVQMLDERDRDAAEPIADADLPRAFSRQPLAQRSMIVAAGPIANFLLAIALYAALAWGGTEQPVPVVDTPPAGSAAAAAGIAEGDTIRAVDGAPLQSWNQLRLKLIDASLAGSPRASRSNVAARGLIWSCRPVGPSRLSCPSAIRFIFWGCRWRPGKSSSAAWWPARLRSKQGCWRAIACSVSMESPFDALVT